MLIERTRKPIMLFRPSLLVTIVCQYFDSITALFVYFRADKYISTNLTEPNEAPKRNLSVPRSVCATAPSYRINRRKTRNNEYTGPTDSMYAGVLRQHWNENGFGHGNRRTDEQIDESTWCSILLILLIWYRLLVRLQSCYGSCVVINKKWNRIFGWQIIGFGAGTKDGMGGSHRLRETTQIEDGITVPVSKPMLSHNLAVHFNCRWTAACVRLYVRAEYQKNIVWCVHWKALVENPKSGYFMRSSWAHRSSDHFFIAEAPNSENRYFNKLTLPVWNVNNQRPPVGRLVFLKICAYMNGPVYIWVRGKNSSSENAMLARTHAPKHVLGNGIHHWTSVECTAVVHKCS